MEGLHEVLAMRVVVGRPARRTPVISTTMSYLVLNPYWNVPRTIAVEDILPKLAEGVDYLSQQRIKVFAGWQEDAPEIDPHVVPWQDYNKDNFPLMLRQEPGKNNALGRIKFIFPNKFAVYLHDTPQRSLFARVQRDFSSGCIRLENARALADYLLADDPAWTPEKLQQVFENGERRVVRIPRPITLHLLYMTAWVDENGDLQFRNDIYGRDRKLNAALLKRRPYPLPIGDPE
jgi:murein L,D-transpeptidase YcbB/YkuD